MKANCHITYRLSCALGAMPGLRSLVARRRSSLTSPPYTVQRNTPSPVHSDTSEHGTTPHTSEGGESPMTERGGGAAEVQETQSQDAGDAQLAGDRVQDASLINGEDAEERDRCRNVNVGDTTQEKRLLETSEVDESGEEAQSVPVGRNINEGNKSLPVSEVSVVCASSPYTDVDGGVEHGTVQSPGSEQSTEQLAAHVKENEGESYMEAEPIPKEEPSQIGGPLENKETCTEKGEEIEDKTPETGTNEGKEKLPFTDSESLKGTQRYVGESCNVDIQRTDETIVSDADVRQETVCKVESWDTGGGCDKESDLPENVGLTNLDVNQETNESQLQNNGVSEDNSTNRNQTKFPFVEEDGNEEPTNSAGEDCNVFESLNESDKGPAGDMEMCMNVSDDTQEPETKKTEPQSSAKCREKTEESSPSYVGKSDECIKSGEDEGTKGTMDCKTHGDSDREGTLFGEVENSNTDGDRNTIETPVNSELPVGIVSQEVDSKNDSESNSDGEKEEKAKMEEDFEETTDAESKEDTKEIKDLFTIKDDGREDVMRSLDLTYDTKTEENIKSLETEVESEEPAEKKETEEEVIYKGESSPLSRKTEEFETQSDGSSNKNLLSKLNQKNTKGGKKCSDLSAMEIESTLASRGVTIVRRVVDNKEHSSRGNDSSKESGTSIKPVTKGVYTKAVQSPFRGTTSGSGSVSLQPSSTGQASPPSSKDLYKSINARGTQIQSSSKINPALLNRRGSFQLTKGVSIHYNPKSGATNTNIKGNTVYSNLRGVSTVGNRGPRMCANPRSPGVQTIRGYPTNFRPRGAGLPQTRRGAPQTNLRGLATPANTRGISRPQRYTGPRATVPRAVVPQPRAASLSTTNIRGVTPQRFRGGVNQQPQPRLPGLPPQGRPSVGVLTSNAGETLQPRSSTMPPQAKYLKTSPDARSTDTVLHSTLNTDKANLPLQSKTLGMSSQPRPPDTLQSPQPASTEVSPQSRASQFSPQSMMSGVQPHSEYGGPITQSRTVEQSPQSVLALSTPSTVTTQTGPTSFTSQPTSASHSTLPSSSHHLSQMSMMDHPSQTSTMGLPPHSGSGGSRLPPHSSGGFIAQPTSMGSSSQVIPSHMAASDRFSSNVAPTGFPNSEYLGRHGTEMFPTYNSPGEYTPHSSTSGFPHMSSADFGLQSTSGGFHAQTNLVGFPSHNDPCAYPQHPSSNEFSSHNPGGVVRPPGSDAFVSHPSCTSFSVQGNPGTYPSIPCSEPYSTPTNPGSFRENTELFSYPGQRNFMMHPGSREFSHYSSSNQMANQLQPVPPAAGPRELPMSQSPRNLPLQNCNQGLSMPSGGGSSSMNDIIGDQYPGYAEPLGHSTYQEIPVNARTNSNPVQLAPNFRESDSRQNFRDSATPQYNSYREPNTQEGMRASQMHSGYRDLPIDPNMELQAHVTPSEQSAHSSFKDQHSARFQEDGMISRYLEQSVLNYPESGSINNCRDQPAPNFGSPASHASPGEQVMSSCRENMNQISFPDTMTDNSARQQLLPGIGEQMNYGSYRGPLEFNNTCEQPTPNLQESINYAANCQDAPNMNQVRKSVADNMYKDPNIPVSSYSVNSHHLSLEGVQSDLKFKDKSMTYPESSILPSFTESFDHSSDEMSGKKGDSANIPHFRGSDASYQRNLSEYTNSSVPFSSQGGGASSSAKNFSYSCLSDSKNSGPRESPAYRSQRGYITPSGNSYSPAQSGSPENIQYIGGSGDNFQAKSDFHIPGDSLVPPDKRVLEYPISQGSSSTNNTQRNPSGRHVPESLVSNPETDISTSVNHVGKNNVVESHKNTKESALSNFLGSGECGETTRSPVGGNLIKSPESRFVGSPEKFTVGMSPSKSDSGSPSTQDRIVIKMKLLHSGSTGEEDIISGENGNITELRLANKSSVKYSLAKYTRWTIDSIINGREDLGNEEILEKDGECEVEELGIREEKKGSIIGSPKKTRRRRNSEVCEDLKDTNLDTNKNFMKKSLKITITNPLRNKISSDDGNENKNVERKSDDMTFALEKDFKEDPDKVQSLSNVCEGRSSPGQEPESQFPHSARKSKIGSGKSPSPSPTAESCSSSTGGMQLDCEGRRCNRGSEASPGGGFCGELNDHSVTSDVKKCSIVIKRIYKNDNYSCYSSSLCDKKTVLSIDDGTQRRSKRRAAVEASERCHKTLRSLDTCDAKSGKISLAGLLSKSKDILSVNLTRNKTIVSQIPQCSVMLYDVFMNRRINQMVCPGCSRHYDSSDSVQVNMNKATISLLCSSCQWLVVKDVHPHEVDSLVPS